MTNERKREVDFSSPPLKIINIYTNEKNISRKKRCKHNV